MTDKEFKEKVRTQKIMNNKLRARKFAKKLKANATPAELLLKKELTKRNIYFKFQQAIPKGSFKSGFYIVDFTFKINNKSNSLLFVEIDGGYHNNPEQIKKDEIREKKLTSNYRNKIIRFTNSEVMQSLDDVIKEILRHNIWNPSIS